MTYLNSASSLKSIRQAIVLLGFVVIAFIWFLHQKQFAAAEAEALDARAAEHLNLATIIAEGLKHITDRGQGLGALVLQRLQVSQYDSRQISEALADDEVLNRIAVYRPSGELVASSHQSMPTALPQDWLMQLRDRSSSFGLKPFLPVRSGAEETNVAAPNWRLPILLPIASRQPQSTFFMLIEMDVGYLASLFKDIDLGRTGAVHLFDVSGAERLRADSSGVIFGEEPLRLSESDLTGQPRHHWQGNTIQSVHRLLAERGFAIAVSQQYEEILEPVAQVKAFQVWLNLAMTGVIGLALLWLVKMLGHQQAALLALQRSETQNQKLIETLQSEHERSRRAASIDHLSGLYNRREFLEIANRTLGKQRSARRLMAVLFLDLDRFKTINDTLGHKTGDLLLQAVAGRIQRKLEPGDFAARFGGDEFVVLLGGDRSEQQIADYTVSLVERISATYSFEERELTTSPSVGVAICPRDAQDVDVLLRYADAAMYSAKQAGRGQFRFYDPSLNLANVEEFQLEQAFSEALNNHQFVLHYQPQISLDCMRVAGYEALVRWEHPDFGLIFPDRFIGVAERSGFIVRLGMEVLRLAFRQLADWRAEGQTVWVGVNVSPLQLNQPGFSDAVLALAADLELDPGWIDLEITETAVLNQDGVALPQLEALRKAGVSISLDDFGCGYAGFAHLHSLPINKLKLDRSLIAPLSNSPDDSPIVSSTISLAKRLGLQVVAEGVETRDQVVSLKMAGCDIAQGYHFSRPMPANMLAPPAHSASLSKVEP